MGRSQPHEAHLRHGVTTRRRPVGGDGQDRALRDTTEWANLPDEFMFRSRTPGRVEDPR